MQQCLVVIVFGIDDAISFPDYWLGIKQCFVAWAECDERLNFG